MFENINLKDLDLTTLSDEQAKALRDSLVSTVITNAREDFYSFIKIMAPTMIPEGFRDGRHIQMICNELQKLCHSVEAGDGEKLQVFLPPGYMKSLLASRLFPAWCFGRNPHWNILAIGNSTKFAEDNFGRPIKELMTTQEYKAIFPKTVVKTDVRAAGRWETTSGGKYFCTGVGSHIAGRRAHISICDDVVSEQTAYSDTERNKINEWYVPGLRTRLLPQGGEVIINTRWHLDDLSGFLLKKDVDENGLLPWRVISVPAIVDDSTQDYLHMEGKPDLDIGTSSWPEFWPTDRLLMMKKSMVPSKWNSLYGQNPTPDEGTIIKYAMWQEWVLGKPPTCDYIVASMDTAFSTKETADYSAITVWGIFNKKEVDEYDGKEYTVSHIILLGAKRGRWEFGELMQKAKEIEEEFKPDVYVIEKKASGQSLIQELRRRGFPVYGYKPETDKLMKMHSASYAFHAQRVWYPKDRTWALEVVDEVCSFPFATHDDYADTVSQVMLWMRDEWKLTSPDDPTYEDDDVDNPNSWSKGGGSYWSGASKSYR
jgi:predicted phage terminase large subunit-like protein